MLAPRITMLGASSPPMASSAIVIRALTTSSLRTDGELVPLAPGRSRSDAFDFENLAAVVVAAGRADVVGPLQFAAVGAFVVRARHQRMMGSSHIALGPRNFRLWDCHDFDSRVRLGPLRSNYYRLAY